MKVKNIVFSGFAAAIFATCAANAATTDVPVIASQAYVDRALLDYTTTENLSGVIADAVTNKADKIADIDADKVGNIATVDDKGQYQVSDAKTSDFVKGTDIATKIVDALGADGDDNLKAAISDAVNGAIGASMTSQDAGSLGAELAKKEDAANKVSDIEANKDSDVTFPTTKAVAEYTAAAIEEAVSDGIDVNVKSDMIANDAITNAKIADGAVTEDKLDADLKTKIDGKADKIEVTSGQVGNIATIDDKGQYQVSNVKLDTLVTTDDVESVVEKYTVSVPKPNCDAESGRCLLSTDTNGNLTWVNVTNPADVSVQ